jgi:PAS domain S-box-containing protein
VGLTPFYEVSDFVIVLILAAAIAVLVKKRVQFDPEGLRYIVASIALTIFSQLCFAFFTDVYGMPYFLGHFFKLVSFYCIYKAIIELGLSKPFAVLFRNLKASEDALKKAKSELEQRVRERTSELVAANKKLAHEIEERRRVDAALELERNKFKSILEAMADCVYIAYQDHGIEYANPAIEKEFGPAEGRKCYEYFHDRTESCPTCKNKGVFTGSSVQWEWYSPKTGKTYEVFDAPVPNVDGSISRLEILHDVTRRKNAEEALRESEVKHRIVADNTYNWEWWRDPEGNFIYNSPSCKRITQHELEEFAADPDLLFKIIHPEDRPAFNRHVKEVEHNDTVGEIEIRILLPDGSLRWLSHACQPVFDETGRLLGRRGSNRDITAQKSVDHALRESEKQLRYLSSRLLTVQETERRRIARELHDELGGALAVLKLKTRFIEKNLQPDQTAISEECRQNLTYIDQIIDDVHRLSRDLSPSILEDIGLTPALRWLIDNFVKHYGIKAAIDFENVDHLLSRNDQIMIYRTYQEALTNIGKHAQAVNVTVAARINEDRISFRVEDDGRGFDVGEFSKRTNSEKGLGLTAMNERAMMLGGEFHLWSEPGKGTRIALSIPITSGERI